MRTKNNLKERGLVHTEQEYWYCDYCQLPCDTHECPNCLTEARKLTDIQCIECGRDYCQCKCSKEGEENYEDWDY